MSVWVGDKLSLLCVCVGRRQVVCYVFVWVGDKLSLLCVCVGRRVGSVMCLCG